MTVPSSTSRDQQAGNGVTTVFTVPFRILDQTHIAVYLTVSGVTTLLVLTTHYSVSGIGGSNTTVTFVAAPANGATVTFLRSVPITQETDYVPNDPFPAESHERALDKLTMIAQQLDEIGDRSLTLPEQVSGVSVELPPPAANNLIGWNVAGTALRNWTAAELTTSIAYANKLYQIFNGTGAQTVFTLSQDPGSLGNLEVTIDGVMQVPGIDFTYALTALTFSVAPANGAVILVRYDIGLPTGVTDAAGVNYTPPSTGALGTVKSFLDALWSTGTNLGASLLRWIQSGTGAVARTVEDKLRERVSAADFGAVGSGDEAANLQAAIDYLDSIGGGVLLLKPGTSYTIGTKLRAKTAVLIKADVKAEVSSNANGGGAARPSITWSGAYVAGAMFEVKANAAGDIVFGGGAEGVFWDGADNIDYAVHLNNTAGATAIGEVRRVRIAGFFTSSQNGNASSFSQRNTLAIHFVYGVTATVDAAHGILIEGAAGNVPATQNRVLYANGLVKNGYMVALGAMVDNCILHEVRAAVDGGGSGGGWKCSAAGGMTYGAESNLCLYLVGKWDVGDTTSNNNRVLHYISEGGTITGTATWHGDLVDYSTYRAFKSHQYALRKKYNITPGMVLGDGTTGTAKFGLQWLCPTFLLGGTGSMCVIVPPDYEVLNGVIEGVEVWIGTNGTSAGNYRMQVVFSTVPIAAGGVVVPDQTVTSTVAAPAQYNIAKYTFDLSPDVAMSTDDALYLQINRLAADAADTNTEDSIFLGARILFKATGPDSGGSGTYAIPSW